MIIHKQALNPFLTFKVLHKYIVSTYGFRLVCYHQSHTLTSKPTYTTAARNASLLFPG